MRIIWHNQAIISLAMFPRLMFSYRTVWQHSPSLSAHLIKARLGPVRIVRLRPSRAHAKRLGLPLV
jgi:hypothetical protein